MNSIKQAQGPYDETTKWNKKKDCRSKETKWGSKEHLTK